MRRLTRPLTDALHMRPLIAVVAFSACALAAILARFMGEGRESAWVAYLVGIVLCLVAIVAVTRRMFGGVFWWQPSVIGVAFFTLTYVARPVQILSRPNHRSLYSSGEEVLMAGRFSLEASFLFLVFALLGFIVASRPSRVPDLKPSWSRARLRKALLGSIALGLLGIGRVAMSSGGIGAILSTSYGRRQTLEGQFYFTVLTYFLTGCLLLVVCDIAYRRINLRSIVFPGLAAVLLIIPLGGRSEFIYLSITVLAAWHLSSRKVSWLIVPIAYLSLIGFVTVGLGLRLLTHADRRAGENVLATVTIDPRSAVPGVLQNGFTGFDRMAAVLPHIPGDIDFQYWTTYTRLLASPIPRVFWPNKPALAEANVTRDVFLTNTGAYPIGPIGEAWLQAGYAGLVFNGFVLGVFWAVIGRVVVRSRNWLTRMSCVIAAATLFVGPGNLSLQQFGMRFVPIWIIGKYLAAGSSGKQERDEAESPPAPAKQSAMA